jgi:hypothetical protein
VLLLAINERLPAAAETHSTHMAYTLIRVVKTAVPAHELISDVPNPCMWVGNKLMRAVIYWAS